MVTISLCMIVKNEESCLEKCLKSLEGIVDEMIVVDTGSTDRTKDIAKECGAKVLDFAWTGDFSDARNFAFAQANCDYIYSADADEELDEDNRQRFMELKADLSELDIDIVQMYYCNQLKYRTVYNFDRELRPKLFKRVRHFVWEDPIHEQVILHPSSQGEPRRARPRDLQTHHRRRKAPFKETPRNVCKGALYGRNRRRFP